DLRRVAHDLAAQHADGARRRREQPGEHGDGGALAGAVLAEKTVEAPPRHAQVDGVDGQLRAEAAGQRTGLDGQVGRSDLRLAHSALASAAVGPVAPAGDLRPSATGEGCATLP